HRHVRLYRTGIHGQPAERVELTVIRRLVAGQRGPQCLQGVIAAGTAVIERRTEKVELLLERTDAHTEDHPSIADVVECAVTLYDRQRMVVPQHQRHRGEANSLG